MHLSFIHTRTQNLFIIQFKNKKRNIVQKRYKIKLKLQKEMTNTLLSSRRSGIRVGRQVYKTNGRTNGGK